MDRVLQMPTKTNKHRNFAILLTNRQKTAVKATRFDVSTNDEGQLVSYDFFDGGVMIASFSAVDIKAVIDDTACNPEEVFKKLSKKRPKRRVKAPEVETEAVVEA